MSQRYAGKTEVFQEIPRDGQSLDRDVFRRGDGSPLGGYEEALRRLRSLVEQEAV